MNDWLWSTTAGMDRHGDKAVVPGSPLEWRLSAGAAGPDLHRFHPL